MILWIGAGLFGLMWLAIAIINTGCLIQAWRRGGSTSLILVFGGVFGAAALLMCPIPGAWVWAWVPALLDPGCLPALLLILLNRRPTDR